MMDVVILIPFHIYGAHQIKYAAEVYITNSKAPHSVTILPVSDGGCGFVDAIRMLHPDYTNITTIVRDRDLNPKEINYLISRDGKTAYIEAFQICGFDPDDTNSNPAKSFTLGIGDAIADALSHNCRNFIIGIEGLATIDGGMGLLNALGYKITTASGNEIPLYRGSEMLKAHSIIDSHAASALKRCRFTIACNDDSAFYAATGPAMRFARKLGANEVTTDILDNGLRNMASVYFKHNCRDISYIKAGGAGGGIAGALASFFNAKIKPASTITPGTDNLALAIKKSSTVIFIHDNITPHIITGMSFQSILSVARKADANIIGVTLRAENIPLLESLGLNNVITSDNQVNTIKQLIDKMAQ